MTRTPPRTWRHQIDTWVHDSKIRRDALFALALLLIALVFIAKILAGVVTGVVAAAAAIRGVTSYVRKRQRRKALRERTTRDIPTSPRPATVTTLSTTTRDRNAGAGQ